MRDRARQREPVPEAVAAHARAAASGPAPEVPARDAATVVLLRDGVGGPEVYLLRRHTTMAFAACGLAAVATLASAVPAIRAALVSPARALRET